MTPLANLRRRWIAARHAVGTANRSGDRSQMSAAMRLLNRARAEYQQGMRAAEGYLAYLEMVRRVA